MFLQDSVPNQQDCVDLGISCANVCEALGQGLKGRRLDELSESLLEAIGELSTWVGPPMRMSRVLLTGVPIAERWL